MGRNLAVVLCLVVVFSLGANSILFAGGEDDPLFPDDGDKEKEKAEPAEKVQPGDEGEPAEEQADEEKDATCKECTHKKMCDVHKEAEKAALDSFNEFRKKKWKKEEEETRIAELTALIEEIAALTCEHPQYKSKKVADALGFVLRSEKSEVVRINALDLMDDRQDGLTCIKHMYTALKIKNGFNSEDHMRRILAAVAYFESPQTISFFEGKLESSNTAIAKTAYDCIVYVDGPEAIECLIEILQDCQQELVSHKRKWRNKGAKKNFNQVEKDLKDMTGHVPDIKASGGAAQYQRVAIKDWKEWLRKNTRKYEGNPKGDAAKKTWKRKITFKSKSPFEKPSGGGKKGR